MQGVSGKYAVIDVYNRKIGECRMGNVAGSGLKFA